jgi:membrane protein implicated in regulation of membrane protease activity
MTLRRYARSPEHSVLAAIIVHMPRSPHEPERDREQDREPEPIPEAIRFYGTRWVDHSGGYALRRAALGLAALLLAAAGAALLVLLFAGVSAGWLQALVVLALTLCTAMAFMRTWRRYTRPERPDAAEESAMRPIKLVGFVGVLLAYALRTAAEAPGEGLLRAEHEAELERHRRTTAKRSGNPARRRNTKGRRRGQGRP